MKGTALLLGEKGAHHATCATGDMQRHLSSSVCSAGVEGKILPLLLHVTQGLSLMGVFYIAAAQVYRDSQSAFYKLQILKSSDNLPPVCYMHLCFRRLSYLEKWF